ncbi:hypothetical protein AB0C47_16175 [Micromonospora taraxaci]|uniref:hypothetical protein n=1 Tax=Micromonospora taraxaci TaxID=1316803 RepID=UPI0033FB2696
MLTKARKRDRRTFILATTLSAQYFGRRRVTSFLRASNPLDIHPGLRSTVTATVV